MTSKRAGNTPVPSITVFSALALCLVYKLLNGFFTEGNNEPLDEKQ